MSCKRVDVGSYLTNPKLRERGEANEFLRAELSGCDEDITVDVFTKNGKKCIGVSSKDKKREKEVCVM